MEASRARTARAKGNGDQMSVQQDYLEGDCVCCGRHLDADDYDAQNVVAAIGPEGTVVCCATHFLRGPSSKEYAEAANKFAQAKAQQLSARLN
jgi:hypothetical protein